MFLMQFNKYKKTKYKIMLTMGHIWDIIYFFNVYIYTLFNCLDFNFS